MQCTTQNRDYHEKCRLWINMFNDSQVPFFCELAALLEILSENGILSSKVWHFFHQNTSVGRDLFEVNPRPLCITASKVVRTVCKYCHWMCYDLYMFTEYSKWHTQQEVGQCVVISNKGQSPESESNGKFALFDQRCFDNPEDVDCTGRGITLAIYSMVLFHFEHSG